MVRVSYRCKPTKRQSITTINQSPSLPTQTRLITCVRVPDAVQVPEPVGGGTGGLVWGGGGGREALNGGRHIARDTCRAGMHAL
jgi:hypothetical protein